MLLSSRQPHHPREPRPDMNLPVETVQKELEARMPDVKLRKVRDSLLIENSGDLSRVALFLKESPEFRLDYLSSVTGGRLPELSRNGLSSLFGRKKTGSRRPARPGPENGGAIKSPFPGAGLPQRGAPGT